MRDRFVKWISSGGGSVARGHMNGAGVSTVTVLPTARFRATASFVQPKRWV
jgi:hypothetical protein